MQEDRVGETRRQHSARDDASGPGRDVAQGNDERPLGRESSAGVVERWSAGKPTHGCENRVIFSLPILATASHNCSASSRSWVSSAKPIASTAPRLYGQAAAASSPAAL